MIELFGALAADYVAANGFLASNSAGTGVTAVLGSLLRRRAERARELLIDEMRRGRKNLGDVGEEEAAAITFRYMRAATEGAARLNLRLLAAVAAGSDASEGTYADEFLRWADALSTLTREEVVVLGVISRRAASVDYSVLRDGTFWVECLGELSSNHRLSAERAEAAAAACLRTGLLQLLGGLMDIGQAYIPSPHLQRLGSLADIEGVLRRSDAGG